jgi:hypothetical protein
LRSQYKRMTSTHKRSEFLEKFAHYATAFVVLMKGLDKIETPGKTGIAILFIIISVLIVLGTIFHHKAGKLLKHFKAYVFVFEAIVMAIVGYLYMKDGKQFIQYVCFATAIMFIAAVIIYLKKAKPATH